MIIRFSIFLGLLCIVPFASAATSNIGFEGLNKLILSLSNGVIRSIGYMLFTLAVVAFFWGIIQFIWSARQGAEGKGISNGKTFMMWGLIGLFVMFSVWGIIKFAQGVFGIQGENTIIVPDLQFRQGGVTERSIPSVGAPSRTTTDSSQRNETQNESTTEQSEERGSTGDQTDAPASSEGSDESSSSSPSEESEKSTPTPTPAPTTTPNETEIKMRANLELFTTKCQGAIGAARASRGQVGNEADVARAESCSCGLWGGTYSNAVCTVSNYGKVYFKGDSAQLEEDIGFLTQCLTLSGSLQNKKCNIGGKSYASSEALEPLLFRAVCRIKLQGEVDASGECVDQKGTELTLSPREVCFAQGYGYNSVTRECVVSESLLKNEDLIPFE